MNKQEAKNLIEKTFSSNFDATNYQSFVANLFKKYTAIAQIISGQYIKESFRQFIVKSKRVGKFEDSENNQIDILEVYLKKTSTLERARTTQRNFVAEYLKSRKKEAALIAFISPDNKEWRLSLVKLEHSLVVVDDKLKTKEEITPAKRWSFLVGENEGSHTAQSQLVDILANDNATPTMEELEQAFSIETVTNEFFAKYTDLFHRMKEALDELIEFDEKLKSSVFRRVLFFYPNLSKIVPSLYAKVLLSLLKLFYHSSLRLGIHFFHAQGQTRLYLLIFQVRSSQEIIRNPAG